MRHILPSSAVSRFLATATMAALFGCGGTADKGTPAADSAGSKPAFTAALLTPGSIADQGWNGLAYDGLVALRDSLGAQISHIQTKTPAEFEENFRQYGAQGKTIVFGHGFEFQDAAVRVAPSYPNTIYVITSGRVTAKNVAGISFAFEEASYQAGIIAGATTKTNTIGLIGGTELPPVKASFLAFERGALSVNPKVKVITSYIGNWDDASAGKEQALAQIARGADIIFQNADAAGLGVFQAAKEKKILAFGTNANQNAIAPDVILGSVAIDMARVFLTIGKEVQSGTFVGRVLNLGVKDDVVRLVLNPQLISRIPPQAIDLSDSIALMIKAGTFHALDSILAGTDAAKPIKP